jgi:hypothetical protein
MGIDGFDIHEIAQKIKNIRSVYCQELKKMNNSKKSGASAIDMCELGVVNYRSCNSNSRETCAERVVFSPSLRLRVNPAYL